jgi:hypothetical protein
MKCTRNLKVTLLAICLITTAAHAQSSALPHRFRVPFPFTTENRTFPAGEYEVTQFSSFILTFRNLRDQSSSLVHVQPTGSKEEKDGRGRAIFHRYGGSYFLATISAGSSQSNYDLGRSKKEDQLADKSPMRQPQVVSVLSSGTVVAADIGRKQ